MSISCDFSNLHPYLHYTEKRLNDFFQSVYSMYDHSPAGVLSVVFMDQNSHNQLHGEFLNDFRPTDVITFPADPEEDHVGEICVSVDMAMKQSRLRTISFKSELCLYLIHGWLHLVGYNDLEDIERQQMRMEEQNCLSRINKFNLWPDFMLAQK